MNRLVGLHRTLDGVEKADEFLMPVALHAAPDDLAFEDIEGGEQGGGAVALVIVRHRAASPFLDRQPRLGAVQCLDLALFVYAEDDRLLRRIQVQAHDVGHLFQKLWIARQLKGLRAMRLKIVGAPDIVDGGLAYTLALRHGPATPVRHP